MAQITREEAINSIINAKIETTISIEQVVDIFFADSEEEAREMGRSIDFDFESAEEMAVAKYKTIQKQREKLNKLKYHELMEEGEKLNLWKIITKQKRLI